MQSKTDFSEAELSALRRLKSERSILISKIEDKTLKDCLGSIVAGMSIYKKLIKKNICLLTEEDPIILDDGEEFQFTASIELTEEGEAILNKMNNI